MLSASAPSVKNKKPTFSGRFHYWLSTNEVTKVQLVLHRPPDLYRF
jgi:hypothetical protein